MLKANILVTVMQKEIKKQNISLVKVLGTGSALIPEITNTSFLLLDGKILVDCGYNVFGKLMKDYKKELNEKLSCIFILFIFSIISLIN